MCFARTWNAIFPDGIEAMPYHVTCFAYGLVYGIDIIRHPKQNARGCECKHRAYHVEGEGTVGEEVECGTDRARDIGKTGRVTCGKVDQDDLDDSKKE